MSERSADPGRGIAHLLAVEHVGVRAILVRLCRNKVNIGQSCEEEIGWWGGMAYTEHIFVHLGIGGGVAAVVRQVAVLGRTVGAAGHAAEVVSGRHVCTRWWVLVVLRIKATKCDVPGSCKSRMLSYNVR